MPQARNFQPQRRRQDKFRWRNRKLSPQTRHFTSVPLAEGFFFSSPFNSLQTELIAEGNRFCQFPLRGLEAHAEPIYHSADEICFQTCNDMRHAFAAPAIAAENCGCISAMHNWIQIGKKHPDRRQRFRQDRRRSQQKSPGLFQFFHHFRNWRLREFYQFCLPAGAFNPTGNGLGQLLCVAVSTDIRQNQLIF